MRLTAFTIENLRAIAGPLTLDGLGGIEVLHGDNNAGKSSVLSGLAFALFLARHPSAYGADPTLPYGISIPAPPQFVHLRPHRTRKTHATYLHLSFEGGPVARVELTLRPNYLRADTWLVRGAWWAPDDPNPHTEEPPPAVPSCVLIDPTIAAEYEARLIRDRRADRTGETRKRWHAVEKALQSFVLELGPGLLGDLDAVGPDGEVLPGVELAWIGDDYHPRPFHEEGSGLRSVKDIVVSSFGSDAPIVLIEEPERHLAADAEQRLKRLFDRLAVEGRQLFITSHVNGFDGDHVWRLRRNADGVAAQRSKRRKAESTEPEILSESAHARLASTFSDGEAPHEGFVSRGGVTRLPPEIVREIEPPTSIAWTRRGRGIYGMVTAAFLYEDDPTDPADES